jgi:hypothetical protein
VTESEFISSIDCSFPYSDEAAWKELVEQGALLSPNAAYAVLYEVCLPPPKEKGKIGIERLKQIAAYWARHVKHSLSDMVLAVALKRIADKQISVLEALTYMNEVQPYPHEYSALAIVSACDDPEGIVKRRHDEIVKAWKS